MGGRATGLKGLKRVFGTIGLEGATEVIEGTRGIVVVGKTGVVCGLIGAVKGFGVGWCGAV